MPVRLGVHLLAAGHDRLRLADLHDSERRLHALDDAGDKLALPAVELAVDRLVLRLADLLQHHLLRHLRGDTTKTARWVDVLPDNIPDADISLQLARVRNTHLRGEIFDGLHHPRHAVYQSLAGVLVHLDLHLIVGLVAALIHRLDGFLDGVDQHIAGDATLQTELRDCCVEFTLHDASPPELFGCR